MIITIDGPGGVGKSSLAKRLAEELGFEVLDTGAMFRAIAYLGISKGLDPEALEKSGLLESVSIRVEKGQCFLDGQNISERIRTSEIDIATSHYSTVAFVRDYAQKLQKDFAKGRNIVAEGRDMGSRIFPSAEIKFYLDASSQIRAERRHKQLLEKGTQESFEKILAEIIERDERDRTRAIAPLVVPQDARVIDTGALSLDAVYQTMKHICDSILK